LARRLQNHVSLRWIVAKAGSLLNDMMRLATRTEAVNGEETTDEEAERKEQERIAYEGVDGEEGDDDGVVC